MDRALSQMLRQQLKAAMRCLPLLSLLTLAACAAPPRMTETVWVYVADIYSIEDLRRSWNQPLAAQARAAGIGERDIAAGRLLRVGCGLGADYGWASYALLPPGMDVTEHEILVLRVDDPSDDDRLGLNPVVGRAEGFEFPGKAHAYRFIPDWRERGLRRNIERIPLAPEQRGRYAIVHSEYLIKCRQPDGRK